MAISAKRLTEMARKWQKMAAGNRKRISYPRHRLDTHYSTANKGHFVVYSVDHKRFVVPLKYLSTNIFRELLKWSEEEFGLPSNGPITLPCDSIFLDYVVSLIRERIPDDVEKALITSIVVCHHEASSFSHPILVLHQSKVTKRMISSKKMVQMAWKWQKEATNYQRKRILWRKGQEGCSVKGHFVVYSMDKRRFVLPLLYLKNNIFRELFKLAEEEFGLSSNVPLTLPCEGTLIEYVITLIQRNVAKDLEEALLMSITTSRCQSYSDLHRERTNLHLLCSY
ncbi:Auxin-responsive protein SAUR66, partial [Mucuna pruriens]